MTDTNKPHWHARDCHAETYDKYAEPQQNAARKLINFIGDISPLQILEPGCGTGGFTKLLTEKFPESQITCVDLSSAALKLAQQYLPNDNITFTCGDIENITLGNYDLIAANAVFQWIRDFPAFMNTIHDALNPGGMTAFSYFSNNTYCELSYAVKQVFGNNAQITSKQFHTIDEIKEITSRFSKSLIEIADFILTFSNLRELLLSIRATGTSGRKDNTTIWTKGKYNQVEQVYMDKFGEITVTYSVILYKGVK